MNSFANAGYLEAEHKFDDEPDQFMSDSEFDEDTEELKTDEPKNGRRHRQPSDSDRSRARKRRKLNNGQYSVPRYTSKNAFYWFEKIFMPLKTRANILDKHNAPKRVATWMDVLQVYFKSQGFREGIVFSNRCSAPLVKIDYDLRARITKFMEEIYPLLIDYDYRGHGFHFVPRRLNCSLFWLLYVYNPDSTNIQGEFKHCLEVITMLDNQWNNISSSNCRELIMEIETREIFYAMYLQYASRFDCENQYAFTANNSLPL